MAKKNLDGERMISLIITLDDAFYWRIKAAELNVNKICQYFLPKAIELKKNNQKITEDPFFYPDLIKLLALKQLLKKEGVYCRASTEWNKKVEIMLDMGLYSTLKTSNFNASEICRQILMKALGFIEQNRKMIQISKRHYNKRLAFSLNNTLYESVKKSGIKVAQFCRLVLALAVGDLR